MFKQVSLFVTFLIPFFILVLFIESRQVKKGFTEYIELGSFELNTTLNLYGLLNLDSTLTETDFFLGKETLVQFSFAGCGPCIRDKKLFPQLLAASPDQFHIVTISIDPFEVWRKRNKNKSRWSKLNIGASPILDSLNVNFYPTYFMVNAEGLIISRPDRGINYVRNRYRWINYSAFGLTKELVVNLKHSNRLNSFMFSYLLVYVVIYCLLIMMKHLHSRIRTKIKNQGTLE